MNDNLWIILLITGIAALVEFFIIWMIMRKKYITFTEEVGAALDCLINGNELNGMGKEDDMLDSKLFMKLDRLQEITCAAVLENKKQKGEIQKMVSDISHQLKTPIANITMYNDTILNHEIPKEKEKEFLLVMQGQVEKLKFLVDALVKMSRLEGNLITLKKEYQNVNACIEGAVRDIRTSAEAKEIEVELQLSEELMVSCDKKWTQEAILNILDNAVKYTPTGGNIRISAEALEMFVKIEVQDSGMGIDTAHLNDIFKRFYREPSVHSKPGIGIGLYLTRNIITSQGGYMKAVSAPGKGSCFIIYLPREIQ